MNLPASINPENMKNLVNHFPQLLTALKLQKNTIDILRSYSKEGISGICFIGMGGSSIAGNYVRALLNEEAGIPIVVIRDYAIPGFVNNTWVVIAVSYSGNTEETISALAQAKKVGTRIITVTSGGMLAEEKEHPHISLPKRIQPRASLPLMLSCILPAVEILVGLETSKFDDLEAILVMKASTWEKWIQPPRLFAESLDQKIPLFVGAQHLTPVAYRAKCQINENSKALAFQSELPESNHNEIESFVSTYGCVVMPIFLRSSFESIVLGKRFDATCEIYNELALNPVTLRVKGKTKLEEMLILTHFLDMVSVEYADIRKVDPVSVEKIKDLKHRLTK